MKEAMLYRRLDENRVHCFLCSQHCHIEPDETGKCGVRQNRGGKLWSLVYGKLIAQHVDPIEKKTAVSFLSRHNKLFDCYGRVQFRMCVLPER